MDSKCGQVQYLPIPRPLPLHLTVLGLTRWTLAKCTGCWEEAMVADRELIAGKKGTRANMIAPL